MQYTDERLHLRVNITSQGANVPADELARMQDSLANVLGDAVRDFPQADLALNVVHHPQSKTYHVEAKLKVPGRTLLADGKDPYLDSAFQRCVQNLARRGEAYRARPDEQAVA